MSTLLIWEAANLFLGDEDPTKSKHLTLMNLKLPSLSEIYQEHHPGGSDVAIEVALGIGKLEASFKLVGLDPDAAAYFGVGSGQVRKFSIYRVIRDKRTGEAIEGKAIIAGRLGSIEEDEWKRGDLAGVAYGIKEITHYELYHDKREKFWWDLYTNERRVDGVAVNRRENAILRVPQTM